MDIRKALKDILGLDALPKGEGLAGFTEDQLKLAVTHLRDIASYNKDARNVDDLRNAVEAFEAVNTELTAREAATVEEEAAIADLAGRITTESDPAPDSAPELVEPEVVPEAVAEPVAEPVAVSAAAPATPLHVVPDPTASPVTPNEAPISLTAAGDVKGHSAGQSFKPDDVANAMLSKAGSARSDGRYSVGLLEWTYPDDRCLNDQDSTAINTRKVNAVVAAAQAETREILDKIMWARDPHELESLTAAGGLCAQVNVRYELFTVGTTARPLRDSLTRFGATRGGIRFNAPPTLNVMRNNDAVNIYTEEQDTTGSLYPKGCIRVECTADVEAAVSAVTLCMEVGNFSRMFNPESFNAWWGLGRVQHARIAEDAIWSRLDALSTNVGAGEGLGASVDTLAQVERAATQFRDRHRIDPETPLRLRAPAFLRNIMRVDLTRRMPGDSTMSVSNGEIARFFASRDIAVTWVLDGQYASGTSQYNQAAGALNPWPTSVDVNLSIDGTFLFLDGGTLDFGTEIRDFTQIRQNDSGAFMESFEQTVSVGPQAIHLTLAICPDGTTSGTDLTTAQLVCASGS